MKLTQSLLASQSYRPFVGNSQATLYVTEIMLECFASEDPPPDRTYTAYLLYSLNCYKQYNHLLLFWLLRRLMSLCIPLCAAVYHADSSFGFGTTVVCTFYCLHTLSTLRTIYALFFFYPLLRHSNMNGMTRIRFSTEAVAESFRN